MDKLVLYGIGGVKDGYRALRYFFVPEYFTTTRGIKGAAENMVDINPSVERVYLVDNRYGLKNEFNASLRATTFEPCVIFKDALEREGIRVL